VPRDVRHEAVREDHREEPLLGGERNRFAQGGGDEVALVDALDPRRVAGARSRVRAVYLVRMGHGRGVHRVFDDRHGVYCEEHGPSCEAVEHIGRRRR
jgi:hypothetical protein